MTRLLNDTRVGKELTEDIHEKVTELQEDIENQGREIVSKANLKVAIEFSKYLFLRTK